MSADEQIASASLSSLPDLLTTIASRVRLEILVSLAHSPKDVSTLAGQLELSVDTISRHLRPLFGWDLVRYDRMAKRHVYRLGSQVVQTVCGNELHLVIKTTQGHQLELRFPANAVIRWDTPSAANRSRNVPNRSGE